MLRIKGDFLSRNAARNEQTSEFYVKWFLVSQAQRSIYESQASEMGQK